MMFRIATVVPGISASSGRTLYTAEQALAELQERDDGSGTTFAEDADTGRKYDLRALQRLIRKGSG